MFPYFSPEYLSLRLVEINPSKLEKMKLIPNIILRCALNRILPNFDQYFERRRVLRIVTFYMVVGGLMKHLVWYFSCNFPQVKSEFIYFYFLSFVRTYTYTPK